MKGSMKDKKPDTRPIGERLEDRGYVSAREAAGILGIHIVTLYKLINKGKLQSVQIPPGQYGRRYVTRNSLVAYLGPKAAQELGITK